jgi:hypothetical protein
VSNERSYYGHDSVHVTNARFVVGARTYAMRNVTSVRGITVRPGRIGPIMLGLLAVALALTFETIPVLVGIGLVHLAASLYFYRKPTHSVVLTSSGGEITAYASRDMKEISRILDALNQAIVGSAVR